MWCAGSRRIPAAKVLPALISFLSAPKRRWLPTLAILALAVAVRVWDIRARALWFDEACEYWVATAPFSHLAESARTGTGDPPLYAFLLHAWMQLGTGEAWLRTLSLLASVSGVGAAMALARAFGGPRAGWCAGLLLGLLPADVRYAQEVGQYGFVPAAVGWNLVCLLGMARRGTLRWVLAWTSTALIACYLYYACVFPVAACFLCAAFESIVRRDHRARRAMGVALVLLVAGLLPLLFSYLPTQLARVVEAGGATVPSERAPGVVGILRMKWTLASELIAFQFSGWPHTRIPSSVVVIPVIAFFLFCARRAPRLAVWLAASTVGYGVAYELSLFPMGYRWGMILTPLIICAIATGLVAAAVTRARWARVAAFALLVVVSLISLPNRTLSERLYEDTAGAWPETEDMRVVAEYWMSQRVPHEPTYVYYGAAPAFAYYTRELARREDLPSTWYLACWHDAAAPGFCRADGIHYGRWMRALDSRAKVASAREMIGEPDSFWIVFAHMVAGDDREMINGLRREGYRVDAAVEAVNASACRLVRENRR